MVVILASHDQDKKWNLFVFEMGPSLKLDSAIKNAIFNQRKLGELGKWGKRKWGKFSTKRAWGKFSTKRNAKLFGGGGPRGVWQTTTEYMRKYKRIQTNTNENLKFTFKFIINIYNYISIYNLNL